LFHPVKTAGGKSKRGENPIQSPKKKNTAGVFEKTTKQICFFLLKKNEKKRVGPVLERSFSCSVGGKKGKTAQTIKGKLNRSKKKKPVGGGKRSQPAPHRKKSGKDRKAKKKRKAQEPGNFFELKKKNNEGKGTAILRSGLANAKWKKCAPRKNGLSGKKRANQRKKKP